MHALYDETGALQEVVKAARAELPETVRSLAAMRDNPKASASARVAAARALLELAGVLGRERSPIKTATKPIAEMTRQELAAMVEQGQKAYDEIKAAMRGDDDPDKLVKAAEASPLD